MRRGASDDPHTLAREGLLGLGFSSQEADGLLEEAEGCDARGPHRRGAEGRQMSGIRTPGVERVQTPAALGGRGRARPLAAPAQARGLRRPGAREGPARGVHRGGQGARRAARPRAAGGSARAGQDVAGPDRGLGARAPSSWPPPGPALERKGDVASYLTALEPHSVFFVDEIHRLPRALEETFYPAMEDRRLPITVGQGAGARVVTLDLPAFTHDRRHHPHRAPHHAAARPLRGVAPARALRAPRSRADRHALGGNPRGGDRRRRGARRSRSARAAPRAWPTGCSSAHATSRRCAAPATSTPRWRARRSICSRWTPRASTGWTARSCRSSARSSAAGRWDCPRWRWRWGRSPTRSRTCTSPTSCSRDS